MFTGIVEEVGRIKDIKYGKLSMVISIEGSTVLEGTKLGDSICTNGVCLTVTNIENNVFSVDAMAETIRRSNLGKLKMGSKVNLERALRLQDRLGGHIVSGHIDGTGEIKRIIPEDNAIWYEIKADSNLLRYVVEKGSIAIDGISLTVAYVDKSSFRVSVIPHTAKETTLGERSTSDMVNIECDVVGKYIEKLIYKDESKSKIDMKFLEENGFI